MVLGLSVFPVPVGRTPSRARSRGTTLLAALWTVIGHLRALGTKQTTTGLFGLAFALLLALALAGAVVALASSTSPASDESSPGSRPQRSRPPSAQHEPRLRFRRAGIHVDLWSLGSASSKRSS